VRVTRRISSTTASSFASRVPNTTSGLSTRSIGRFVRHDNDVEPVGIPQLSGAIASRPCHPAQPRIAAEKALERDRGQDPSVVPPRQPFLCLDRATTYLTDQSLDR